MPMENSITGTPNALAAMKCPNSWSPISTPKIRMAMIMYLNIKPYLLFLNMRPHALARETVRFQNIRKRGI